jgi:hypothetical protein
MKHEVSLLCSQRSVQATRVHHREQQRVSTGLQVRAVFCLFNVIRTYLHIMCGRTMAGSCLIYDTRWLERGCRTILTWTRPLFSPNGSAVRLHWQHTSANVRRNARISTRTFSYATRIRPFCTYRAASTRPRCGSVRSSEHRTACPPCVTSTRSARMHS